MQNPFRYFNRSPEVIRLTVMMYIRYPFSLRQAKDLLFDCGADIRHETVRFWWNRFGPMFAAEIRKRRVHYRLYSNWRWHLYEVFVRINDEREYHWCAIDHEGEVLKVFATNAGIAGPPKVSKANDEALRPAVVDRDGPSSLGRCSYESDWEPGA